MRKARFLTVLALLPFITAPVLRAGSVPSAAARTAAATGLLDINTASREALIAIKGIGPVYADSIIKGRPYARKNQLLIKRVVPKKVYDAIKDRITTK